MIKDGLPFTEVLRNAYGTFGMAIRGIASAILFFFARLYLWPKWSSKD